MKVIPARDGSRLAAAAAALRRAGTAVAALHRAIVDGITSAVFIVGALVLIGTGLGIAAVYILAGLGWCLAAASGFAFALATVVAAGARRG